MASASRESRGTKGPEAYEKNAKEFHMGALVPQMPPLVASKFC